jgi:hypothetical protein
MIPVRFRKCRWNSENSDSLLILAQMTFADYQQLVLKEYKQKREAGDLSRRLSRPTPAKIKEECEVVCDRRHDRRDEKTLEEFFGSGDGDRVAWVKVIRESEPSKFKPIINFVKGKTTWPDPKVVELLAWLIDFKRRPHDSEGRYPIIVLDAQAVKNDELAVGSDERVQRARPEQVSEEGGKGEGLVGGISDNSVLSKTKRRIAIAILLPVLAIAVVCWLWPKSSPDVLAGHQACMYWAGDRYEKIACNQKVGDTLVIPLDPDRLTHFRKITRPDTITENALGSIWYSNIHGVYECFTAPGNHPIDTNIVLKPLRDYVLIRHIHGDQGAGKTSK